MENIIYDRDYTQEVKEVRDKTYTKSSANAWAILWRTEL